MKKFLYRDIDCGGEIRHRMDLAANHILEMDVDAVFARHFKKRKPIPEVPGHFAGYGMLLDAVVKAVASGIREKKLADWKEKQIAELIRTQSMDGSISIFSGKRGVWDNHEQAYIIQAFVQDYALHGNQEALKSALRLGFYLIKEKTELNLGLESAFLMLYRESGERAFLDYCLNEFSLAGSLAEFDGKIPVNGSIHVYTWIARVLAQFQLGQWTDAGTGNLPEGVLELYRRIFGGGYPMITGGCSGVPPWGEIWDRSQDGFGRRGETCAAAYLMRMTGEMIAFDGGTRYGDLFERIMYNTFFAAQSPDGKQTRYFVPVDEPFEWYPHDTYCCPNNFRRMLFEIPENIYFQTSGNGIYVNLYTDSTLKTERFRLVQKTAYPETTSGSFTVRAPAPVDFELSLRIPGWCRNSVIRCGGVAYSGESGGVWKLHRRWHDGDKVEFDFANPPRMITGYAAQTGRAALMRGPLVYGSPEKRTNGFLTLSYLPEEIRPEGDSLLVPMQTTCFRPKRMEIPFCRFSSPKRMQTYFDASRITGLLKEDELFKH